MSENPGPDVPQNREAENAVLTYALTKGVETALYSDAPIDFILPNADIAGVYDFDRFLPLRSRDNRYLLVLNYAYDAIDTRRIDVVEHPEYARSMGFTPFLDIHLFDTVAHTYHGMLGIDSLSGPDDLVGLDGYPEGTEVEIIMKEWKTDPRYAVTERDSAQVGESLHRIDGILNGGGVLDFGIQEATIHANARKKIKHTRPHILGTENAIRGLSQMGVGIAEMVKEAFPPQTKSS
jgi:hypothetical protein